jgi:transcriptional regulator of acetoin/glycerol metabolism
LRAALGELIAEGDREDMREIVRPEISASWSRSAAAGLSPDTFQVRHEDVETDGPLLRAARPVVDALTDDLDTTRVSVLLTAGTGQVIDRRVSNRALNNQLDRIELAPGAVYIEDQVGTNAIGTALAQKRVSVVDGREHFADVLTTMTCAASPITDLVTGDVLGVLDLSCFAEDGNPLMLPLVRRAAQEIERRSMAVRGGRPAFGWSSLTDTERSVVELVGRGLSNREAAERLFMSRYTVDSHLRSIFRKLDINSRVALARAVVEQRAV